MDFKVEAVKMAADNGYSLAEVGWRLEVNPNLIGKWRDEMASQGEDAFPDNGKATGMEEELRRLRKENGRLKMEREILKRP